VVKTAAQGLGGLLAGFLVILPGDRYRWTYGDECTWERVVRLTPENALYGNPTHKYLFVAFNLAAQKASDPGNSTTTGVNKAAHAA